MGGKTTLTKFMGARLDTASLRAPRDRRPGPNVHTVRCAGDIKTQRGRDTMGMFYLDMRGVPLNFIIF